MNSVGDNGSVTSMETPSSGGSTSEGQVRKVSEGSSKSGECAKFSLFHKIRDNFDIILQK